jgi:hypothetical protein
VATEPNNSEQFRHECEVAYILRLPTKRERAGYLGKVRQHRGNEAADKLEGAVYYAWKLQKQTPP